MALEGRRAEPESRFEPARAPWEMTYRERSCLGCSGSTGGQAASGTPAEV